MTELAKLPAATLTAAKSPAAKLPAAKLTTATPPTLDQRVRARLRADLDVSVTSFEPLLGGHSGLTYRVQTTGGAFVVKAVPDRAAADRPPRHAAPGPDHAGAGRTPPSRCRGSSPSTSVEPAWFAMELVAGESLEPVLDDPAVEPGLAAARMRRAAEVLPRLHDVRSGHRARCRRRRSPRPTSWRAGHAPCTPSRPTWSPAATDSSIGSRGQHPDAGQTGPRPRRLPARQHPRRWRRTGRADRLGDLERRRPPGRTWAGSWSSPTAPTSPASAGRCPGCPPRTSSSDRYACGGPALADLPWFDALGRFKMAAIMGHNLRRHREGRHHDPDQERLARHHRPRSSRPRPRLLAG